MSTYNGEKYIKRQIETLLNQKDVDIHVLIRDDGSKDNTVKIIKNFSSDRIELIEGTNIGFAQSFWTLLKIDNDYDYYAFCDQDDIWHEDKLISAINKLSSADCPALYTSDVIAVDSDENIIKKNAFGFSGVLNYYDSLLYSVLPGCTFVFNKKLKEKLALYDGFMISHDWTTYIVANIVGKVFFDPIPHINYRIHSNNSIGVDTSLGMLIKKINRFIKPKETNTRSRVASNILKYYESYLKGNTKKTTHLLAECPRNKKSTLELLKLRDFRKIDIIIALVFRRV